MSDRVMDTYKTREAKIEEIFNDHGLDGYCTFDNFGYVIDVYTHGNNYIHIGLKMSDIPNETYILPYIKKYHPEVFL